MKKRVCVVVLGDIGHSPRMQYHVQSLLNENFDVDLVGYVQTDPIEIIKKLCHIRHVPQMPELGLPKTLNYIFKTSWQVLSLFIVLFSVNRPEYLMCQNPPAIPTLFVCYVYCLIMRVRFIIDWHNYAHTIMALNNSPNGIFVKISRKIEFYFGRKSYANFCVTKAMKDDLERNLGINYSTALALVSNGKVNVSRLVTHHFDITETAEAFKTSRYGLSDAIKVMVHCQPHDKNNKVKF